MNVNTAMLSKKEGPSTPSPPLDEHKPSYNPSPSGYGYTGGQYGRRRGSGGDNNLPGRYNNRFGGDGALSQSRPMNRYEPNRFQFSNRFRFQNPVSSLTSNPSQSGLTKEQRRLLFEQKGISNIKSIIQIVLGVLNVEFGFQKPNLLIVFFW